MVSMGICCPESSILGMMGTLYKRVVVWGGYVVSPPKKLLDLEERSVLQYN